MKSFKQYLKEFAQRSTSEYVFDTHSANSSSLKIPISTSMFKRIWPDTIRATVFHTTDLAGLERLGKLEGGKKTISAFFSMFARYLETGVATSGDVHVVVEMEADVLVSAKDDVWSQVDNKGRRWVEVGWFANAQSGGTGPKFAAVERELNDLIRGLVVKHLGPIMGQTEVRKAFEYDLWADMKKHLSAGKTGGGKRLSLVIKDYFDGVERIIKNNSEVMGNIFHSYAKGKRMTENESDEQIVYNIENIKVHVWKTGRDDVWGPDEIKQHITDVKKWPIKVWDASIEIEIYTREVTDAEKRTMGGWSRKK